MPASLIFVGTILLVLGLDLLALALARAAAAGDKQVVIDHEHEGWITDTIQPTTATTDGEEAWASSTSRASAQRTARC